MWFLDFCVTLTLSHAYGRRGALLNLFTSSFPLPHQAVVGIDHLADALKANLRQDARRCTGLLERVSDHHLHVAAFERDTHQSSCSFSRIASALVVRCNAVGDLNDPFTGGTLKSTLAYLCAVLDTNQRVAERPRIDCRRGVNSGEPLLRYLRSVSWRHRFNHCARLLSC